MCNQQESPNIWSKHLQKDKMRGKKSSTIIIRNFNTSLSMIDRKIMDRTNKYILNNPPILLKGILTDKDKHMLGQRTSFPKF